MRCPSQMLRLQSTGRSKHYYLRMNICQPSSSYPLHFGLMVGGKNAGCLINLIKIAHKGFHLAITITPDLFNETNKIKIVHYLHINFLVLFPHWSNLTNHTTLFY
jgi:hypothetical protein